MGTALKELLDSHFGTSRGTLAGVSKVFCHKTFAWWHVPCHGIMQTALLHCGASC